MHPRVSRGIVISTLGLLGLGAAFWFWSSSAPDEDSNPAPSETKERRVLGRAIVVDEAAQSRNDLDGRLSVKLAGAESVVPIEVRSGTFSFDVPDETPYVELVAAEFEGSPAFSPVENLDQTVPERIALPVDGEFELRLYRSAPVIVRLRTYRGEETESRDPVEARILTRVTDSNDPRIHLDEPTDPPITTTSPHRFEDPFPARISTVVARFRGDGWNWLHVDTAIGGEFVLDAIDGADLLVDWSGPTLPDDWLTIRTDDSPFGIVFSMPVENRREARITGLFPTSVRVNLESGRSRPGLRELRPVRASHCVNLARSQETRVTLRAREPKEKNLDPDSTDTTPVEPVMSRRAIVSLEAVDETGAPLRVTELQWRHRTRRGDPKAPWQAAEFDPHLGRFQFESSASVVEVRAVGPDSPADPWPLSPREHGQPRSGVAPPQEFTLVPDRNDLRLSVTRMCRVELTFSAKGRPVPVARLGYRFPIGSFDSRWAGFHMNFRDRVVCWIADPGRVTIPSIDLAGDLRSPALELTVARGSNPERIVELDDGNSR